MERDDGRKEQGLKMANGTLQDRNVTNGILTLGLSHSYWELLLQREEGRSLAENRRKVAKFRTNSAYQAANEPI